MATIPLKRKCIAALVITLVLGVCILSTGCVQDSSSTSSQQVTTAAQTIRAALSPTPTSGIHGQTAPDVNVTGAHDNSPFPRGNDSMRGDGTMPRGNMTGTPPNGTRPSGTLPSGTMPSGTPPVQPNQ